jgi:mono/diheme cytochrome c family protein
MADRRGAAHRGRAALAGRWTAVAAVLVGIGSGCTPLDDALANIAVQRSMRWQPSLTAYDDPLPPPEGSIPFASGNFPQAPGMVNTGQPELVLIPPPVTVVQMIQQTPEATSTPNPVPASEASLARGEVMFDRECSPCHGTTGAGDGLVAAAGVPARSLLAPEALALTDGYIYNMIRFGRGGMPSYGYQIAHFDRWNIVNYVRQLQAQAPQPAVAPAAQE